MARTAARNKGADQTALDINPQKEIITPLQAKIDKWVESGYAGASELSRRLLSYWFGGPHPMSDGKGFFLWHPHQRRAVETTIYLYEVEKLRRTEEYAELAGQQRTAQKAPWAKIGLQMATGSGKTKVMSLLMVWAHLHWQMGDGDNALGFGNTQLLLAPNLIVLERLLSDFAPGKEIQANIFILDPLLPPELRNEFSLQVVTPDNIPAEWQPSEGYLVVANIQKLFTSEGDGKKEAEPLPEDDPMFDLFNPDSGGLPTKMETGTPRLLEFVQSVQSPLLVFNDEAHHVHDEAVHYGKSAAALKDEDAKEGIAWNRVLMAIQKRQGLSLQIDLSATLFEETTRQWFKHTVYDYPLQQAIREGIVKQPFMGKIALQYKDGHDEPIPLVDDSATNAFDKYTQLIQAGIAEWKKEQTLLDFSGIARKALLFIVCSNKTEAAQIATRLEEFPDAETGECLFAGKVIEIHIGRKEATNEKEWQKIREDINRVDSSDSPYTAVVSVMMLKEGWDVRNVKVIVPLRPCDSRQLTEQLLGRGLRRMFPPAWTAEGERRDGGRAEGLYVIRHPSFERIIKNIADIIEDEPEDGKRPNPTRVLVKVVEPEEEREKRDLPISVIVGEPYDLNDDWIDKIGRGQMPPLPHKFPYVQDLKEIEGIIKHEGATGADVPAEAPLKYDVQATGYSTIDAVVSEYAGHIRAELRMTGSYTPNIKGIVKAFLERCTFDLRGIPLSLEAAADYDEETRQIVIDNIRRGPVKQQVIQNVAKIIGQARAGKETPDVEVSTTYAKDLTEYEASPTQNIMQNPAKSVHTLCCFDSGDELEFAKLLDEADDVVSWLWNDQSGVGFRIQYSFEGRMPYYYPDFLVRLTDGSLYIVESKGSIRERDRAKQARAERYADILREATGEDWCYIFLVNDSGIRRQDMAWWRQQGRTMFRDLVKHTQNAATGSGGF
ncbi:MAG: DEAD/DEAH box helicase [Janthinobacterium lividum]